MVSKGALLVLLAGCFQVSETFAPGAVVPHFVASPSLRHQCGTVRRIGSSRVLLSGGLRAAGTDNELRDEFSQLLGESGRDVGMKGIKPPKGSLEWVNQQQEATGPVKSTVEAAGSPATAIKADTSPVPSAERPAYAVYADGVGPTPAAKPMRPSVSSDGLASGGEAIPPALKSDVALTMF